MVADETTTPESDESDGAAAPPSAPEDPSLLHAAIAALHQRRNAPATLDTPPSFELDRRASVREERWLRAELARIDERAAEAPSDAHALAAWLRARAAECDDPLLEWLELEAPMPAMRFFLEQELASEVVVTDDVVALASRGLDAGSRDVLAQVEEGWPSVAPLVEPLALDASRGLPESLARGNLMASLAYLRRYGVHAVGALAVAAVAERAKWRRVRAGLARLGMPRPGDVEAARAVDLLELAALAGGDARLARWLAEGALVRVALDRRALAACRRALDVDLDVGRAASRLA